MGQSISNVKNKPYATTWKLEVVCLFLAAMFAYTGLSKWLDWHGTKAALYNQVFPVWMAEVILYGLPPLEVMVAMMLLVSRWRSWGLWLSVILMALFTAYIALVLTRVFGRVPCSCGGVLDSLGWWEHLGFNVVVLGMGVWGVRVENVGQENKSQVKRGPNVKNQSSGLI
ncbi:MauE/DoxX family redox-associated membrane protein [Cecembia lonarensis]|uniref:Methylamine utilisation protein MauE domain-containing protein n=1 Tax=Cecembia lonarensis (strain CCUG 58316 / KCTC 22772 / LW9) TaxID=1225176 RepID=K1KX73_CECL9|nr:MauE/DoxX family redox-associated membrane protein [Cecembia lonarensis]EKB48695.1 hypothetical protein B879_02654 [Cecembia lonarensis LW9]